MMLKEIKGGYNPHNIESDIEQFWQENNIYNKVRKKKTTRLFFFVDGPPYTTGKIHMGTAWNKIIKDYILRYKTMCGYSVMDRPGWDMHGLPIEVKVEEILNFKSKKNIEEYGIDRFVECCINFAIKQKDLMTDQFKRLGVWMDWENPYISIDPHYIETAWWTLKESYHRGILKEDVGVINWCPRCETAIAESEVEYKDVSDPSIYVLFPIKKEDYTSGDNTFILIWTTTPWTIPANIAIAVNPDLRYVEVFDKDKGRRIILAENCISLLGSGNYDILRSFSGRCLEGIRYIHPLTDLVQKQNDFDHKVILADFVTDENTGCVHIAPGHGEEDYSVGKKYDLPIFCPVNEEGIYTEDAGKYKGIYVKKANNEIIEDLRSKGLLFAKEMINHRYGHCWRCKTPVIYLATSQWYLDIPAVKEIMLEEIKKVKWYPDWAGSERFYNWVLNAKEWCISRQRYWGIPIPIWRCKCGHIEVIGGINELKGLINDKTGVTNYYNNYDDLIRFLHRPNIDRLKMRCKVCGEEMSRVKDVFDVWFDSAIASWATLNFPAEKDLFEKIWPAEFITEGHDQTRGWFYSQLGASSIVFGRSPYKNVLMHGFVLDVEGNKMSKSLRNVVYPEEIIAKYGTDALRFYFLSNTPWEDLKFSWDGVDSAYRTLNIIWNVYKFPLPYMILDNFEPDTSYDTVKDHLKEEDRWILSRLYNLIKSIKESLESYNIHTTVRQIRRFVVDDLSRWYIQIIRPRTWIEEENMDKLAAYYTIFNVLVDLTKVLAPIIPYLAEFMYQNLCSKEESVHLSSYPEVKTEFIDDTLERDMDIIRDIVESAATARNKSKRNLRWPVKRLIISSNNEELFNAVDRLKDILLRQTNSMDVEILKNEEAIAGNEIVSVDFSRGRLYLDLEMTDEIVSEGYAREIIRRIQQMRKDLNLNVDDFITVFINAGKIAELIKESADKIAEEVRADKILYETTEGADFVKNWRIQDNKVDIGIKRIDK
ncbi:isoleucine--tRNA ligase [Candidatus Methanoliparum sp. LAM-1]|nr:isoleucine--tRNA ligase [Candidatus Methanoliparum sp. LAM-1]